MIELLAPAGSMEQFMADLSAGADAVYLGGTHFSARRFAANFTDEEMTEAVRLAHIQNVAVYVTLNTLLNDQEMKELPQYVRFLDSLPIDGLLVQDIGVASIVHKIAPHIPLHASTQMSVSNLDTVQFLEKRGFKRIVLSRELSIDEIRYITQHTDCEIEIFIHGALCVSYSGQCLMSSFLGNRSGNRGACAQPCRMPYDLVDGDGHTLSLNGKYLLSLKDLMGLHYIPQLIEAGVSSLKIEGRMKNPHYAYEVVSSYRKAIDGYYHHKAIREEEMKINLQKEFNRGYDHAYLTHTEGSEMITRYAANNLGIPAGRVMQIHKNSFTFKSEIDPSSFAVNGVTYLTNRGTMKFISRSSVKHKNENLYEVTGEDSAVISSPVYWTTEKEKSLYVIKDNKNKIPVSFSLAADEGKPVSLTIHDDKGRQIVVHSDYIAEKALKHPTSREDAFKQCSRLGNTLFSLDSFQFKNNGCMLPKSTLNHLRTEGIALLENERISDWNRKHRVTETNPQETFLTASPVSDSPALWIRTNSLSHLYEAWKEGITHVIFGGDSYHHLKIPFTDYKKAALFSKLHDIQIYFASPRIVREADETKVKKQFLQLISLHPYGVYIEYPGLLSLLSDINYHGSVLLGSSFNLFNSESLKVVKKFGVSGAFLSPELTLQQIHPLTSILPTGAYIYGRQELMISEYCALNAVLSKRNKKYCLSPCRLGTYALQGQNHVFPVKTDEWCRMHILNSAVTDMCNHMNLLKESGLSFLTLDLRDLDNEAAKVMHRYHKAFLNPNDIEKKDHAYEGHFFKGVL